MAFLALLILKGKHANYALFIGFQSVGIVEAKAKHRDIPAALKAKQKFMYVKYKQWKSLSY